MTRPASAPPAQTELSTHWPTVLAAALAIGVGMMGVGFYSLGLFVAPLQAEFGWSRAQVSGAATFQQLGIFLSAPIVGRLADRFGNRTIAVASYIATPLAFLALARTGPSLPAWYGLWLLVSLAGCGTTPAIWARVVSLRFDRERGLALGLMLMGTGTAAMLAPALLGPLIAAQGWRAGLTALAAVVAAIGIPVSLLTGRGERSAPASPSRAPSRAPSRPGGRMEINPATVRIALIGFLLGVIVAALIVHLVPMLIDRGIAPAQAARMAAVVGMAVIAARLVVGWLFDRFHAPRVACLFLTSPVIACAILWLDGPAVPAALLLGLAAGAEVDMLAYFTSRYAALENYGATYGAVLGLFSLGAAFGPPLFGWAVDAAGGSGPALACAGLGLVAVLALIATLGPYRRA